jgi:hypothetical protein
MISLSIATILSIVIIFLLIFKILKDKKNTLDTQKLVHENFLQTEEINQLKYEIDLLKQKELILYLVAEMLHNKEDRDATYGLEETSSMLSKARTFTPYYGAKYPNVNEMKRFIEYLANDAWIKIFKKPASETDCKVKEWFDEKGEKIEHRVAFGKTSEAMSIKQLDEVGVYTHSRPNF